MGRKRTEREQDPGPEALSSFREALDQGDEWFDALLEAIAHWETPEEEVGGRSYRYLIGGEAFDWLLLAERLCEAANGTIPVAEREALLFFGRPPRELSDEEFKHAIGAAKHRAHLNFLYGVMVEEALQLTVEQEVHKERRTRVWDNVPNVDEEVFDRIYGRGKEELLAAYRENRGLPSADKMSYGEMREFEYWLFKFRVNQADPARVASDTRKALAQISELEGAAHRRRGRQRVVEVEGGVVVEGEVVARAR